MHRELPRAAPRGRAVIAGVVAAAVALSAGELVAGVVGGGLSLVTAVGDEVIDRFAARLKELAVSLFGTNDKAALVTGIVVVALVLGGLLGLAARRRRAAGVGGLVAFGVLGWWAYATDAQGSAGDGFVIAAVASAAGVTALLFLLRSARPATASVAACAGDASPAVPAAAASGVVVGGEVVAAPRSRAGDPRATSRRRFVVTAAGLGAGAVAMAVIGRRVRTNDVAVSARRRAVIPRPVRSADVPTQPFTVPGLSPYVTPNASFYRIDTALAVPQVDVGSWTLEITGLVDRPLTLGYDELLAMDAVEQVVTLQCVSNEIGGNLVGNGVWQGVPLRQLLDRAGLRDGAEQVVGRSVDGFTAGFPTSVLDGDRTALVAYAMNGEPLPIDHGFPARLVVAGLYGYVSATKWLRSIELTTWDGVDGYWVPRGWAKEGPIKTASRIDVPTGRVTAGTVTVAGVAWAPTRGISAVELQVDDGPWAACELGRVASADTWVQWRTAWTAEPGTHTLRVRATDGTGEVQAGDVRRPDPDGATGWHARRVTVQAG